MKRTISGMIGAGSLAHNRRDFIAENVDPNRVQFNICYQDDDLKEVYGELFDDAVGRYNVGKRKDRQIENYYEKIRQGKQEKLFHEVIIQIGNCEDMASGTKDGDLAVKVLDEYVNEFQKRNPTLRVFGCYLHQDEATPHLHIDFVPYVTGWKGKGMDTRVSLKQALKSLGFQGGNKHDTELNQWINHEKEVLAEIAKQHGIEWEQKDTHKEHLSVLDFKKEMRTQEVKKLEKQVDHAKSKVEQYEKKLDHLQPIIDNMSKEIEEFSASMEELLPKAGTLEMGSGYREKKAKPFCAKMKKRISSLAAAYTMVKEELGKIQKKNKKLVEENKYLKEQCGYLQEENKELKKVNKWFDIVVKVFGRSNVDCAIERFQERERLEAEEKAKKNRMQKPTSIKERLAENKQAITQYQKKKKIKDKGMER